MLENRFVSAGTLARPGFRGRVLRVLVGIGVFFLFYLSVDNYDFLIGYEFPTLIEIWVGALITFYYLSDVFNIGLNRRWGRWPQYIFCLVIIGGVFYHLFSSGSYWGPLAGWLIYLLVVGVSGFAVLAFFLAAILATPG